MGYQGWDEILMKNGKCSSKQFGDVPPGLNFLSGEHGQSAKFICHGDHHEK